MIIIRKQIVTKHCVVKKQVSIGSYKFSYNDLLGAGNQSKVYRGINTTNDHQVAVKVINPSQIQDNLSKKLLKDSLVSLQTLKHSPNILNLYQIFYTEKMIYVVTEICSGDLSEHIEKKLTQSEALEYIKQIVKGFKCLYEAGIVHRDIKPDNIFVNENDEIKIGDFGFAARLYQVKKQVYFNIGSPAYMSPQVLMRNQYSHQSDIWAIGISFYEMLTGEVPWSSIEDQKVKREMNQNYITQKIDELRISQKSRKFLLKALSVNRCDRFSPEELIDYFSDASFSSFSSAKSAKQTEDLSTNWSYSVQLKHPSQQRKQRYDCSYQKKKTQQDDKQTKQTKNKTNQLFVPKQTQQTTLSHGKNKKQGTLHHLLSPQKNFTKKQTGFKYQMNHIPSTNRAGKKPLFTLQKGLRNRNLDKIIQYYLDLSRKIMDFLIEIEQSNTIMKKYSQQIVLMKICLRNILIKTSQKIINLSQSHLLEPYASMIDIAVYRSSDQYEKSKLICAKLIQTLKQNKQLGHYWPKAKQQNIQGAINATVCFLKKIKTNLEHYYQKYQNKELIKIAYLCVAILNKLTALLTQDKFQQRDQFYQNQPIKEQGATIKAKILNQIQQVFKTVQQTN